MIIFRAVFVVSFLGILFGASLVSAQIVSAFPAKKTISLGENVSVKVVVSSPLQAMNAVSAALSYPASLSVVSIDKGGSVIDFWTEEPHVVGGKILFEGVALSPGYQGSSGVLFTVTFSGKKQGIAQLVFTNAAILANDGLGSNIIKGLGAASIAIGGGDTFLPPGVATVQPGGNTKSLALPVIIDYSPLIGSSEGLYLKGKGEPGAITKIVFHDASFRSIGEQFIASLQTSKRNLSEALVKNDPNDGTFEYASPPNLLAGAYNATPFLVDDKNNVEKPGLGVQLFVSDSRIVRGLVVFVNILALLIPIVGLIVLIYFIPWYSFRRMRVIKRRLGLEEEKIELSAHELNRQDKVMEHTTDTLLSSSETPK